MTSTPTPPAAGVAQDAVARVLAAHFELEPVTATFTGIHYHDARLPDWSVAGLERATATMNALRGELATSASGHMPRNVAEADRAVADAHLEIRLAEHAGTHFQRANPALYTGEAIFSIIALATREIGTVEERMRHAAARARAIPQFLAEAKATLGAGPIPPAWTERAIRECNAAKGFFDTGIASWITEAKAESASAELRPARVGASAAFGAFAEWLKGRPPARPGRYSCGADFLELLLRRGHWCATPRADLLAEARERLAEAEARLGELSRAEAPGGWPDVQRQLEEDHTPPSDFMASFAREWDACRAFAESANLVTWSTTPVKFVQTPAVARAAAPSLYFLNYRSPAPFDAAAAHEHYVPTLTARLTPVEQDRILRATNRSVIRLNHVIHHAALGHHVQNHHAAQSASRIGRVAAVDGASRIAMFGGGTMAEGWACYAVELAEEFGFLTPVERVAVLHTRVRLLARAVVDLCLHSGEMSLDQATAFYAEHAQMPPANARAEAVKNSMFPGAAVMYWLGTRAIHALRAEQAARGGSAFSLRAFHDAFLSFGALPVPMIASLMSAPASA